MFSPLWRYTGSVGEGICLVFLVTQFSVKKSVHLREKKCKWAWKNSTFLCWEERVKEGLNSRPAASFSSVRGLQLPWSLRNNGLSSTLDNRMHSPNPWIYKKPHTTFFLGSWGTSFLVLSPEAYVFRLLKTNTAGALWKINRKGFLIEQPELVKVPSPALRRDLWSRALLWKPQHSCSCCHWYGVCAFQKNCISFVLTVFLSLKAVQLCSSTETMRWI